MSESLDNVSLELCDVSFKIRCIDIIWPLTICHLSSAFATSIVGSLVRNKEICEL